LVTILNTEKAVKAEEFDVEMTPARNFRPFDVLLLRKGATSFDA